MRTVRKLLMVSIRGYKTIISPWLPSACRFTPTCSEFALAAVERYGVFRGSARAVGRVLRCHPFTKGGFDPVV
jgi:putative membrane protein insertion efficiency factor